MTATTGTIDPVTFEVLRHRLWTINDGQATVLVRTSGSPTAQEAKDFNCSILAQDGQCLFVSIYAVRQSTSLDALVRAVRRTYGDDVHAGDMFYTNDPWCGVAHGNDCALLCPVFSRGALIGWTGVTLHDSDVGAPEAGINPAARDAHGEAPLIPPVKLLAEGELQADVEKWIVRNVRSPALNALNLRARIAAMHWGSARVVEVAEAVGLETFGRFQAELVSRTAASLRSRLRQLPDGVWTDEIALDHDGRNPRALSWIRVRMTKTGDRLALDLRGTDPQSAGPVNCAYPGLLMGVYASVMTGLCFDIGWCPAAVNEVVEVISDEGTINNARYPAAVGLSGIQPIASTQAVVRTCISRMFAASSAYRDRARAHSSITATGGLIWSFDRQGRMHTTQPSFLLARGSGAAAGRDGIDTGGHSGSPGMSLFNVETAELSNPGLLVLYRRQSPETAGAGAYRGGLGMELGLTAREGSLHLNWGSMGFHHPQPQGLMGGEPSSISGVTILRGTDLAQRLVRGDLPSSAADLSAERTDVLEAKCVGVDMRSGDVLIAWGEGGGGYGDPLERAPVAVARDLAQYLFTSDPATTRYGVVIDSASGVDEAATAARRDDLRRERLARAGASSGAARPSEGPARCRRCHADLARAVAANVPLASLTPYNRYAFDRGEVTLEEILCPSCGARIDMRLRRAETIGAHV